MEVSLGRLFLSSDLSVSMQCRVIQEKVTHEKEKKHTLSSISAMMGKCFSDVSVTVCVWIYGCMRV